ncbi:hypothetical protein [Desulfovibrio aminophilus]|uniref:hypothetical protein n=1 Tax=Desulfovibrio aminophilus TaxID=81425 RepID=UPI0033987E2D
MKRIFPFRRLRGMAVFTLLVVSLLWRGTLWAFDDEAVRAELADEHAMCAAYQYIVLECINDKGAPLGADAGVKELYRSSADYNLALASFFSDVRLAALKLNDHKSEMKAKMNSCVDVSLLVGEYEGFCRDMTKDPKKSWAYWKDRK